VLELATQPVRLRAVPDTAAEQLVVAAEAEDDRDWANIGPIPTKAVSEAAVQASVRQPGRRRPLWPARGAIGPPEGPRLSVLIFPLCR